MGSDLYRITALNKTDLQISMTVDVIHPDSMYIPADESFALMILREAAEDTDPIAREIAFEDTLDQGWMTKFARGFIRKVKVSKIKNEPPKNARFASDHAYWKRKTEDWMTGQLDVTVTHPTWLEHIKKKAVWSSRAFSLVQSYDPHPGITPEAEGEAKPADTTDAFIAVPRDLHHGRTDGWELPPILEVPAYGLSAYTPSEKATTIDAKKLAGLIGRAVIVEDDYKSIRHGTLGFIDRNRRVGLFELGAGSYGAYFPQAKWIARAVPKAGRRGTRLDYRRVLGYTPSLARVVSKKGKTVSFAIRLPPDGRKLDAIKSETDAFALVARAIYDDLSIGELVPSDLTTSLQKDLEARGHTRTAGHAISTIAPEVVKKYVAAYTLSGAKKARDLAARLDKSTYAQAKAILEEPWAEATLDVTVTNAKWIAHLVAGETEIALHTSAFPKPKKA